jgi:hypothetical protein
MYIDEHLIRAMKLLMDDRNWSKSDLAKRYKVAPTTVSRWFLNRVDRIGKAEWGRMKADITPFLEKAASSMSTDDPLLATVIQAWAFMTPQERLTVLDLAARATQRGKRKI